MPPGSANASNRAAMLTPSPIDVIAINNDIAEIDADPKCDAFGLWRLGITVDHSSLDLDGTADRVDNAREFRQHAVAGGFDDAAAVFLDLRIDQLAAMGLEPFERAFFV